MAFGLSAAEGWPLGVFAPALSSPTSSSSSTTAGRGCLGLLEFPRAARVGDTDGFLVARGVNISGLNFWLQSSAWKPDLAPFTASVSVGIGPCAKYDGVPEGDRGLGLLSEKDRGLASFGESPFLDSLPALNFQPSGGSPRTKVVLILSALLDPKRGAAFGTSKIFSACE